MRPRVFPAEDHDALVLVVGELQASMRPRVFPAEDIGAVVSPAAAGTCFNEAAGIPRGRPARRRRSRTRIWSLQ